MTNHQVVPENIKRLIRTEGHLHPLIRMTAVGKRPWSWQQLDALSKQQ